ncbi:MerR family transcriptional regulator (plasmid) [Embleya sp. NBC_00888]|uniref:MerR family transcriptional regulator n=1 Tax=Embleya sp. NBC_00888 TaxID=2975960 RepID=UPI002F91B4B7|nr:MerR family transcriptional regulator [Embleya sp. NBC_00888]
MKSSGSNETLSIGAVAGRFGLPTHVLRHWETMGLLSPARDTAGRRRYGTDALTRVAVILRAKEAGLSLAGIRSLTTADSAARREILRREAEAARSAIAAARSRLDLIECALGCDHEDVARCPHFRRVLAERIDTGSPSP